MFCRCVVSGRFNWDIFANHRFIVPAVIVPLMSLYIYFLYILLGVQTMRLTLQSNISVSSSKLGVSRYTAYRWIPYFRNISLRLYHSLIHIIRSQSTWSTVGPKSNAASRSILLAVPRHGYTYVLARHRIDGHVARMRLVTGVVRSMRGRHQSRIRRQPGSRRVGPVVVPMMVQLRVVVESCHAIHPCPPAVNPAVPSGTGVHPPGVHAANSHSLQSQRVWLIWMSMHCHGLCKGTCKQK